MSGDAVGSELYSHDFETPASASKFKQGKKILSQYCLIQELSIKPEVNTHSSFLDWKSLLYIWKMINTKMCFITFTLQGN